LFAVAPNMLGWSFGSTNSRIFRRSSAWMTVHRSDSVPGGCEMDASVTGRKRRC
jgi:hypothetical protein